MVCPRCISAVRTTLEQAGLTVLNVELGLASVQEDIPAESLALIAQSLHLQGFELLTDRRQQTVDLIRSAIIEYIRHDGADRPADTLSNYLTQKIGADYSSLSKLFSELTGNTIEHYAILQRIERVKELITYDELSLSQIADQLGYSSVAYLSSQFKQVTGRTPSQFKASGEHIAPLDSI